MQDETAIQSGRSAATAFTSLRDRALLWLCRWATKRIATGQLTLTMPSGMQAVIGRGGGVNAHLSLADLSVIGKAMRRGSIGFAEAYIDGALSSPNLGDVLRFFVDNKRNLAKSGGGLFGVRSADRRFHRRRSNSREGARRNIAAHYDLGNAFYATWLDRTMTYSSARFGDAQMGLEAAQAEKNARIIRYLGLEAGHTLLEIGCGWGGFAEAAGRAGARVKGVTISAEQLTYARSRIAAAGLDASVELAFQDYRDITGTSDRIASIEMIEAVGEDHWPSYFATLSARLKPNGVAVIQAITIAPEHFERYRSKADFIQRYIFPGGMLPTEQIMAEHAAKSGLSFEAVDRFGLDYAATIRAWKQAFERAWPRIAEMGFDDKFRRMWIYYLIYCEVGFERGMTDVGHYRFRKLA